MSTTASNRPTGALLGDLVPPGTSVRIYRNLRPGVPPWSVMVYGHAGTRRLQWRVAGHATDVALGPCTFRVYEAGRQRVLRTGVDNVHSFIQGQLLALDGAPFGAEDAVACGAQRVAYNPRHHHSFTLPEAGDAPVMRAGAVWLTGEGEAYAVDTAAR
jgi:hypothetical protein